MKKFVKVRPQNDARVELHNELGLTGAEISINRLPAGEKVPFIHFHKKNEEIYTVLEGKGKAIIDGETIELMRGDWIKVAPAAKRQFLAADEEALCFACIQVREGSLEEYTADDAVIEQ